MSVDLIAKVDAQLRHIDCERLARQTQLQRRTPIKILPADLLRALCLLIFSTHVSLEGLAVLIGFLTLKPVSKQAVAKRLSASCVEFVRNALYSALNSTARLPSLMRKGVFAAFTRVLIQDSTCLLLPAYLSKAYPGSRNRTGKSISVFKIQAVYDLLAERFVSFLTSGFTRNDQRASSDILDLAQKGDLILRDLGYFVLSVFEKLNDRGAFFLSRLPHGVSIQDVHGKTLDLLRNLRHYGRIDQTVILGKETQITVRLVAIPVSPSVAAARRRKVNQDRDQRSQPSKERLALLDWEIFITNVPPIIWTSEIVCQVYGVRWRIEIIFKAWKSHFHFTAIPRGSQYQIETLIYARLIFITLFQMFAGSLDIHFKHSGQRRISLLKLANFFSQNLCFIVLASRTKHGLSLLEQLIKKHCVYAKRKKQPNFFENVSALG